MSEKTKNNSKSQSNTKSVMEQLLEKYSGVKAGFYVGDKVKGKILRIEENRVILDIGGKSEGMVAEKAFKEAENYIKTLKEGDEIEAMVIVPETREGYTILSFRKAVYDAIWKRLEELEKGTDTIFVEVKGVSPSGVTVFVEGLTGFIPRSQLGKAALENLESLPGERIEVAVIDADRTNDKVILSEKEVSEAEEMALAKKAVEDIKEGDIFEGTVESIYDFGCFVKVEKMVKKSEAVLEGLVHISELSWEKVRKTEDSVKTGDKVKVKVIGKTKGKLAFSIKQAQDDPWMKIEKYKKDEKVKGRVVKITDFGVFVALESGVEGLIHMTKIPPNINFEKGQEINVTIEEVDKENRKIALGLVLTSKPVGYK